MPSRLVLEDVVYAYGDTMVLTGVNLTVDHGQTVVISGTSGSGKSTLLEVCAGLLRPNHGRVMLDGEDVWRMSPGELVGARQRIGFVFQHHGLISNRTAFENIALPLRYHRNPPFAEVKLAVSEHMERLGIYHLRHHRPEQLSLGQARQVAIARALILQPDLLFLDEPASGLDPVTAHTIIHLILTMRRNSRLTVVMVSHIIHIVRQMRSPVLVLRDGALSPLREDRAAQSSPDTGIASYLQQGASTDR